MSGLVCGTGIYEKGKYAVQINNRTTKEYALWTSMLERCYSIKCQMRYPTYIGCTASENFKNFQYFAEWCNNQIGFNVDKYQLDKDLIIYGNKLYSEDTCVFVPQSLNSFLTSCKSTRGAYPTGVYYNARDRKFVARISDGTGTRVHLGYYTTPELAFEAYKTAKEDLARQLAAKWLGLVDARVIEALNNLTVSGTD